jgi:methionyl aminopeptidase
LLSKDALRKYRKSGSIASEVRKGARALVNEGTSLLEICEWVENEIRERGGQPAFPCNICVNEVAAHYSPAIGDKTVIPIDAVVKIDLGVHVDGYIADTASTVSLSPQNDGMVYAINEALKQAIKAIKPGTRTNEIGSIIQKTIERYGYKPIWNLSGHQMSRYILHTGKSIPNVFTDGFSRIEEDDVFAIEPFLTLRPGVGKVMSLKESYIYRFNKKRHFMNAKSVHLQELINYHFKSLPFSKRWLSGLYSFPEEGFDKVFNELMARKSLIAYPVLVEKGKNVVAQAEHTIIVTKKGCIATTL